MADTSNAISRSGKLRLQLTFAAIILPNFLYSIFRFSVGVMVPSIELVFSVPDSMAGVLVSAGIGFTGVGAAVSGYVSSKIGEVQTILAGMIIFSFAVAAAGFSDGFGLFSFFFTMASLGGGMMTTLIYSIVGALLPTRKGTAVSLVSAVYNVGGFVGPALSGYLLVYVGWISPFLTMSILGVIVLAIFKLVAQRRIDSQTKSRKEEAKGDGIASGRLASSSFSSYSDFLSKRLLVVYAAIFFGNFGFLTYTSWTPKYLISAFDVSKDSIAVVDSAFGIGLGLGAISIVFAGVLFDKIGGRKTALLSGPITALASLLVFTSTTLSGALIFVSIAGFLFNWFWIILTAMAQNNVPAWGRARATSLVQTFGLAGGFAGPITAGLLGVSHSPISLMLTVVVPFAMYVGIIGVAYKERRQPIAGQ